MAPGGGAVLCADQMESLSVNAPLAVRGEPDRLAYREPRRLSSATGSPRGLAGAAAPGHRRAVDHRAIRTGDVHPLAEVRAGGWRAFRGPDQLRTDTLHKSIA